jgi:serine/threonine protein kinase
VSELLEGESFRQILDRGAIPARKALDYARQIADGLAAAHDKKIVHRDLKPDNVFLTAGGRVKILDFGLAKMASPLPESSADGATATIPAITSPGMVMGTAGYMAPEQVRGQAVDHRADIFSFGPMFYEMLTGRRAFHGETAVETLNAILKEDPPEPDAAQRIAPALDRVVRHCLEKKPDDRFQSARDLMFAWALPRNRRLPQRRGSLRPRGARCPPRRLRLFARCLWRAPHTGPDSAAAPWSAQSSQSPCRAKLATLPCRRTGTGWRSSRPAIPVPGRWFTCSVSVRTACGRLPAA